MLLYNLWKAGCEVGFFVFRPPVWRLSGVALDVWRMSECRCMNVYGNILTLGKMRAGCSFWKTGKATERHVSCDMHCMSL